VFFHVLALNVGEAVVWALFENLTAGKKMILKELKRTEVKMMIDN
jgi:hypothetical protein